MATAKTTPAVVTSGDDLPTEARALVDLPDLGVKCGELIEGEDGELLKQLAAQGQVDTHPDAVAYARKQALKRAALAEAQAE
jgi:hypothetical protein